MGEKVFLKKANDIYFNQPDTSCLILADTNGLQVEMDNVGDWTLEQYYSVNRYQPSRHKVYVMYSDTEKVKVL